MSDDMEVNEYVNHINDSVLDDKITLDLDRVKSTLLIDSDASCNVLK